MKKKIEKYNYTDATKVLMTIVKTDAWKLIAIVVIPWATDMMCYMYIDVVVEYLIQWGHMYLSLWKCSLITFFQDTTLQIKKPLESIMLCSTACRILNSIFADVCLSAIISQKIKEYIKHDQRSNKHLRVDLIHFLNILLIWK